MKHASFATEIVIAAAPDVVYDLLADPANLQVMHPLIVNVEELERGTDKHGSVFYRLKITDRLEILGLGFTIQYRVLTSLPGNGKIISDAYQSPKVHLHNETEIIPQGSGVLLREQVTVEAPALLMRYTLRQAQASHQKMFENLKIHLERGI